MLAGGKKSIAFCVSLALILFIKVAAFGSSEVMKAVKEVRKKALISRAEFSGIRFKTRYQTIKIDTPILVEMENETRFLTITLKNPETTTFKFLIKITPRDFEKWQKSVTEGAKDVFLMNNQRAHFVSDGEPIKVGEVTINTENFEWLKKYKLLIEESFKNCKIANSPKGYPDMVCPPFLIEAKITRVERSDLSPTLPEEYEFPYLDYIDIYIEIDLLHKQGW